MKAFGFTFSTAKLTTMFNATVATFLSVSVGGVVTGGVMGGRFAIAAFAII